MTEQQNIEEDQEGAENSSGETMEALLAQQAAVTEKLAGRQVTWVKVIQVAKDAVLVDVGEKKEGTVPLAEFAGSPPSIGQRVPVVLVGRRDGVNLSYKRARAELGWEAAVKAHKEKARVRGHVDSAIKGGFLVDVGGVAAFLPASLADLRPVRDPKRMIGTGVRCYIIELNEAKRQLVLSRKAVLEEEVGKRRSKLLDELRVGEVRIGRIVSSGPSGLVVDVGGAEGVVRSADLAWGQQKPPALQRGDKLRVKILSKPGKLAEGLAADPAKEREGLVLGVKQLTANPADFLRKKFPPKSVVHGKVVEAGPNGVRIELDAKESKEKRFAFSSAAETDPATAYKPGDPVGAIVIGVNPQTFDVAVSLAKFDEIKDRKRVAQYLKAPPPLTLGQLLSPDKGE